MIPALITVGLLLLLACLQALLSLRDGRRFRPPGSMAEGLHVVAMGEGSPAIVFEAGIANSSLSWTLIQPQLARQTATYSYDRAGLGWSAPEHEKCSLERIAASLHRALDELRVPRPLILVGHSFGGYVVRYFAHRFPQEVASLVLVDPATPEEWMTPNRQQRRRLLRAVFFTRAAGVLACFGLVRFGLWLLLLRKKETPGPLSRFSQTLQRIRFELQKIPSEILPLIRAHWSRPRFYWSMAAHLQALPECARVVSGCPLPEGLPVTVLSGAHQTPERRAEHADLATKHLIAEKSGHFIHFDEPALVVRVIREMLETVQSPLHRRQAL